MEYLKLYFVRHGESFGNVAQASGRLDETFDASQQGELTPTGRAQAEALAERLEPYVFDHILCSPLPRARDTILPFLRRRGLAAELWPEFVEMPGNNRAGATRVREDLFCGAPIEIPAEQRAFFTLREDEPGRRCPSDVNYPEGLVLVQKACERLLGLYDRKNVRILFVGHACNGSRVLERLLGIEPVGRFWHPNTAMSFIEQMADGRFVVRTISHMPPPHVYL